jgi:exodeoxyribonuclease V alpha subunit
MMQPGLAKAQFSKSFQRTPWVTSQIFSSSYVQNWPLFVQYLTQKKISYFDYILTQRLLRDFSNVSEETVFFVCHLILSAKEGHLCIKCKNNQLFPPVNHLWKTESGQPLSEEEIKNLSSQIQKGLEKLPSGLISKVETSSLNHGPQTPICHLNDCFYLQKHWIYESLFLNYLNQHLNTKPIKVVNTNQAALELKQMRLDNEINDEQLHAIQEALSHSLSLITGGPGTGKTYTAGKLIRTFWKNLSPEDQLSCQIALAAPTGKAASNLQNSLSNAIADLKNFPTLQAKTLHGLLNLNQINTTSRLNADLVLIDESTMIDIKVMAHLFKSLKKGARLILLGDPHQLPSVEAGNAFIDLNEMPFSHPNVSTTHLSKCLRTELASIVNFAGLIKNGQAAEALLFLNQPNPGIKRLHFNDDPKKAQKELIAYLAPFFPSRFEHIENAEILFPSFNSVRLLSPMRKGPFGTDVLNQLIWQSLSQNNHLSNGWMAIPILITANDYFQGLFNGETGLLIRKLPLKKFSIDDFALFIDRNQDGQMRKIASVLLPKFDLAYCLSVHKSQGSEFNRVILALPEGSESFGRQVFYTAITRARQEIEIYGSDSVIKNTILQQETRLSGIFERLSENWQSYQSCAKI